MNDFATPSLGTTAPRWLSRETHFSWKQLQDRWRYHAKMNSFDNEDAGKYWQHNKTFSHWFKTVSVSVDSMLLPLQTDLGSMCVDKAYVGEEKKQAG